MAWRLRVAIGSAVLVWTYCLTAHVLTTAGWSPPLLDPLLVGVAGAAVI